MQKLLPYLPNLILPTYGPENYIAKMRLIKFLHIFGNFPGSQVKWSNFFKTDFAKKSTRICTIIRRLCAKFSRCSFQYVLVIKNRTEEKGGESSK